MTYTEDPLPNATTVWAAPKTIYSIDEDRFIPKMLANKLVVLSTGEWVLPFWRENAVLGKDASIHANTRTHAAFTQRLFPLASYHQSVFTNHVSEGMNE